MQLTESEYSYFSQIASKENYELLINFTAETERLGFLTDTNSAPQIYRKRLVDLATTIIESRVKAYIDTFNEFKKYPDKEDLDKFIEEAKPFVINKREFYVDFFKNPLGPNMPEAIVEASIKSLDFALQGIFREGLRPLDIYYTKGIAIGEQNAKSLAKFVKDKKEKSKTNIRKPWTREQKIAIISLLVTILAIFASLTIPELRKWLGLPN